MGEDPGRIRQDIEQTRTQMGDTVEALGYKADVPGRAKEKVRGARERITGATPDTADAKQGAKRAVGVAQENPLGLAIGAAALGFLAGMTVPSTKIEDERIGPVADDLKDRAREAGQEAVERGKEVAQETAAAARDTAVEKGKEHAEEMRGEGDATQSDATQPDATQSGATAA
jgi:hypothetical protein